MNRKAYRKKDIPTFFSGIVHSHGIMCINVDFPNISLISNPVQDFKLFEIARLKGTPSGKIILQTRLGHNVKNSQSCQPDAAIQKRYQLLRKKHLGWITRKAACGFYNCFGLVWANRRTAIYEESEISKILSDDGFRQIKTESQLQPGDVVLYRLDDNICHAAIVLELRPLQSGTRNIPWVLSKWSDAFGEDIHALLDVPDILRDCQVEFLTDRLLTDECYEPDQARLR